MIRVLAAAYAAVVPPSSTPVPVTATTVTDLKLVAIPVTDTVAMAVAALGDGTYEVH